MSYLSVNTWSLHRHLGPLRWSVWNPDTKEITLRVDPQPELTSLLDLPKELAARGFQAVDICHFNFPSTEPAYLQQLKASLSESGVRFHTLLLDYGDISSEDPARVEADLAHMRFWIDVAAQAGAERIRIVAGESKPDDKAALERSATHLNELSNYAKAKGVQVITENFRSLSSTAKNCLELVDAGHGEIGLIADFGNFHGEQKYSELAAILPNSASVHAKAHYDSNGIPDADEYRQCLNLLKDIHWDGAIALVYDGPGNMWDGLERAKSIVSAYL